MGRANDRNDTAAALEDQESSGTGLGARMQTGRMLAGGRKLYSVFPVKQRLSFSKDTLAVFLPGSGLGFWHQFGQLHGLFGGTHAGSCWGPRDSRFVGVSAGALASTLFCCGVTFPGALQAASSVRVRVVWVSG